MTATTIDEQVYAAERTRADAIEAQDIAGLERLLAPGFTYVHASGRTEEKEAYLASLASGTFQWSAFTYEDTVVRALTEDTALMHGFLRAAKQEAGQTRNLLFRFAAVWVRGENGWSLAFMQNAKPVAPSNGSEQR